MTSEMGASQVLDGAAKRSVPEFVFVIENGLGHAVHALNIERVLRETPRVRGEVFRVSGAPTGRARLVRNWSLRTSWSTRRLLQDHLSSHRVDAVFIHTQVASLLAQPIMRAVPTVVSLDATPFNFDTMAAAYGHKRHGRRLEELKSVATRRALRSADAIVTWSQWAADSVARDYGVAADRVHVIPPGVDLRRFRPRERDGPARPVRALFVGGDFTRKGGPELLEAIGACGGAVELDIVSQQGAAPASLPVRVHTDVGANSEAMIDLLGRADIFVLPSRGDCTPLAISEALASGLPVVTTSVGALPELVVDGWNGLVVAPQDPAGLATALSRLAGDPTLRAAMGRRSRMLAESDHDVGKNCNKIFDIMTEAAAARSPLAGVTRS